jgi:hypothetical protein
MMHEAFRDWSTSEQLKDSARFASHHGFDLNAEWRADTRSRERRLKIGAFVATAGHVPALEAHRQLYFSLSFDGAPGEICLTGRGNIQDAIVEETRIGDAGLPANLVRAAPRRAVEGSRAHQLVGKLQIGIGFSAFASFVFEERFLLTDTPTIAKAII